MMVRRIPPPRADKVLDEWNGGELITPKLDKGFPYDDGDNTISDAAPKFKKQPPVQMTTVGKLNGENVTKEALKNLIQDRTMPVTQELVQLEAEVSTAHSRVEAADFDRRQRLAERKARRCSIDRLPQLAVVNLLCFWLSARAVFCRLCRRRGVLDSLLSNAAPEDDGSNGHRRGANHDNRDCLAH